MKSCRGVVLLGLLACGMPVACGSGSSAQSTSTTSGSGGGSPAVEAIYSLPASLSSLSQKTFYDQPWPNDLRVQNGSPVLTGYYNPLSLPLLDEYVSTVSGLLDGFSPAAPGYMRFTGPIDTSSLPATPKDALDPKASVQLIDVDPLSPEHGQRKLLALEFHGPAGVYYESNTLAYMPLVGFPLLTHTRYALVVTDSVLDTTKKPLVQSATMAALVGGPVSADSTTSSAKSALASAVAEVVGAGIAAAHIVHLAVFTTGDPTAELIKVRDGVAKTAAAPTADPTKWVVASKKAGIYTEYTGSYGPSPNYQAGKLPFLNSGDGGEFTFDASGLPIVQSLQTLRFSLMVPDATACPMPAGGYPIVLYAHGTGGDYESYVQDGTGEAAAQHCMAMMGVDQIFQGTRPGSDPNATQAEVDLTFYNFTNPVAGRTNGRQSAIDEVQRARLFTESKLTVPASVSVTGAAITFDGSKMEFFGHSQGGLNGPLFTAIDPSARGGVFSGSGALLEIALLDKTSPSPSVAGLVSALLGLAGNPELDLFHPAMSLLQTVVDVVDPIHYGRLQATAPRPGFAPKSIYMTEGINPDGTGDTYAPPPGIEAHALAIGLPLQIPFQHAIPQVAFGGPAPVMVPAGGLSGDIGGGKASGILAQWPVPAGDDGHFVVFDVPAAREQAAAFNQNLAAKPGGRVPAP